MYFLFVSFRPPAFDSCGEEKMVADDLLPPSDDSEEEGIGDMVVNLNRPAATYREETDSSECESDEG